MKKYLIIVSQTFSYAITYRLQVLITALQGFTTPLLMLMALSFTRPQTDQSAASLLPYYLVIGTVFPLIYSKVDEDMDDLAATGEINNFLTKPIDLYFWFLQKSIGEKLSSLLYITPVFFLLMFFFSGGFLGFKNFIYLLISLSLSFLIYFNLSYLVGLFCFWIDEFWAIHNVKFVLMQLLGGFVVPIGFFPKQISDLVSKTPFYFTGTWNTRVVTSGLAFSDLTLGILWILVIRFLITKVEKQAIFKYSHTGS